MSRLAPINTRDATLRDYPSSAENADMWKTLFMAFGLFVILVGAQCLVVGKFILKARAPAVQTTNWVGQAESAPGPQRELVPTEWAPFSLMAGGCVVWLYAGHISNRMKK
jgi:hypothetical protein